MRNEKRSLPLVLMYLSSASVAHAAFHRDAMQIKVDARQNAQLASLTAQVLNYPLGQARWLRSQNLSGASVRVRDGDVRPDADYVDTDLHGPARSLPVGISTRRSETIDGISLDHILLMLGGPNQN